MDRNLPRVTEAEWSILERLWEEDSATVRQLTDVLYPKGGPSEYATVHKLLDRLVAKGYVHRDRGEGVIRFRALVDRDAVLGQQLEALVEKMCGGSLQPLLTNLVRVKRLTPDELRELLALVESLDPQKKPKKDRE
jgi:BlaI family penicillinase repressor